MCKQVGLEEYLKLNCRFVKHMLHTGAKKSSKTCLGERHNKGLIGKLL